MRSFDDVRKLASRRTVTVPLCLVGELGDEYEQLEAQLADVKPATNLADASPRRAIVDQMEAIREQMVEATVDFHLRAFSPRAWGIFWDSKPERAEGESAKDWDERIFPFWCDLVAKSCVDPEMEPEQVAEFAEDLNNGSWTRLVNQCILLNHREVDVPNFAAASDLSPDSEQT